MKHVIITKDHSSKEHSVGITESISQSLIIKVQSTGYAEGYAEGYVEVMGAESKEDTKAKHVKEE